MSIIDNALNVAAVKITDAVGTMYCAIVFAGLSLVSLPNVLASGDVVQIVSWIAQTFLQLVLLSVIMVGQNIQARETARLIAQIEQNTRSMIDDLRADHAEDMLEARRHSRRMEAMLAAVHAEVVDDEDDLTPVGVAV